MTRALRFTIEPRDVPPEKAARRLGLTIDRFGELLPQLLSRGFPPSDPDTGNYDLDAIDEWRRSRHHRQFPAGGNVQATGLVEKRLRALGG